MPRTIVITGSTYGIGYGLAEAFLSADCNVVISGRTQEKVEQAISTLAEKYPGERILGRPCDVTAPDQVQALWDVSVKRFGRIDIWINNAGIAHPMANFWEIPYEQMKAVVTTNVLGAMVGSAVAIREMMAQGGGSLYNMEGLGSDGRRIVKGLALYATTKAGLHYLNIALAAETQGTPVIVGSIRPGMVMTNMITGQYKDRPDTWERTEPILNALSESVEVVAPWIVRRVLDNRQRGARIHYGSPLKIAGRLLKMRFRR